MEKDTLMTNFRWVRTFSEHWLAPVSLFLVLTSLMWLPDRGYFPKIHYLVIASALLLGWSYPRNLLGLLKNPLSVMILSFVAYFALSCAWSVSEESTGVLLKRQMQVVLFICFIFLAGRASFVSLCRAAGFAMVFAVAMALYEIFQFYMSGGQGRLASQGALSNPLLISHIYGFFAALWLACLLVADSRAQRAWGLVSLFPLLLLLVLTGSRTPLVAFFACFLWLVLLVRPRMLIYALAASALAVAVILVVMPQLITERGVSYRPEIWANVLAQSKEALWLGHGLGAALSIKLPEISYAFSDPHNMTLSVLYRGGVLGLLLWAAMYCCAASMAWRRRTDRFVVIASATVIYGLMAGMTEGGALFPRPKEHWFLLWIPLALLLAALDRAGRKRDARVA
ncbi:MAG: O-antigen ligase family protein [Azonexus sp.]